MYCYKIKASIKDNCINSEYYKEQLLQAIKKTSLIPLGNDEYGTDDFAVGIGFVCYLGRLNWFIENAQELIWYNGEYFDIVGDYNTEDSLQYYINKRKRVSHRI